MTAFIAVSQMVGQLGTYELESLLGKPRQPETHLTYGGFGLLACVGVGALAYLLVRQGQRDDDWGIRWAFALTCAVALVILTNAFPSWLLGAAGLESTPDVWRRVILVAFAATWCFLYSRILPAIQDWFQTPTDVGTAVEPAVPSGSISLIVLVSRIDEAKLTRTSEPWVVQADRDYSIGFASMAADIRSLEGSRWPWQQLLRAINRFLNTGRPTPLRVILVGSADVEADAVTGRRKVPGSFRQLARLCKPFLERFPDLRNSGSEVVIHEKAADFEDFNDVIGIVRYLIEESHRLGYPHSNIFVDITGGQKIASVAAAAATIGAHGQFQYVGTNPPYEMVVSDLHDSSLPMA